MAEQESDHGEFVFDRCWACDGTGFCSRCQGNGRYIPRGLQAIIACDACNGSGACRICGGTGRWHPEANSG